MTIDAQFRCALIDVAGSTQGIDQAIETVGLDGSIKSLIKLMDFDSIDEVEFLMALEERLDVDIADHEAEKFLSSSTVREFLDFIEKEIN